MAGGGAGGKEVGRLSIRVVPDMAGFREEVWGEANAAAKGPHPEVEVDADTSKARRKIDEIKDEKGRAVIDLDADTHGVREKIKAETEGIRAKVHVDVDQSELNRTKNRIERFMANVRGDSGRGGFLGGAGFASMVGSHLKVPDITPNFMGLGGFASVGIIVAALSLVAPALALLSQALVGLPALVTAVALPIGTLAVGFKGIKEAAEASGILDLITGKTSKSGKKGKDKDEPGEVLKQVQEQVSDVFKTGLTPVFRQIAGVIPTLARGLPFVAQGLVKMAEGFGNILATPAFQQGFDRLTNSIGTMLTNLSPALQLFTSGMMNLITNVGDHLPGLGNKMTEWAGQFQNWVDRISKPQSFWGKDVPNSSTLDKAVHNLGPELDTLFGSIGNLINRGLDLAGKPGMVQGIQDALTGLEHLIDQASRLGPVFEGLATAMSLVPGVASPKPDPKAPYGTRPGPAGSGTTIPITHDEAMNTPVGFPDDPVQWLGDKAKGFLGHMFDGARKFVTEQTIGGNLLSMLFGGITPPSNAAESPFNPGTPGGGGGSKGWWGSPQIPPWWQSGLAKDWQQFPTPPGEFHYGPPADGQAGAVGGAGSGQTIKAPKIEAPKLPPGSEKIWEPLVAATQVAGSQISQEVGKWGGVIAQALAGAAAAAEKQGEAVGAGFAAGITASTYRVQAAATQLAAAAAISSAIKLEIKSPSQVMKRQGEMFAQGFDDGMSGGFQGVIDKAGQLSAQVADAMKNGGVLSPQLKAAVAKETAAIGVEYDKLKVQEDSLDKKDPARKDIQAQMKQLKSLRDQLGGDTSQSKYDEKYGGIGKQSDSMSQAASMITTALAQGLDAMKGFVTANVGQLEGDLGMSGHGAVEELGNYGVSFLSGAINSVAQSAFGGKQQGGNTYHFHSADDTTMNHQYERVKVREMQQYTQRSNV